LASTGSRIHSAISFTALQQQALSAPPASQGWQLTTLASTSAEEKLEVDFEIERLEQLLGTDVAQWESRLQDINKELSGKA
jgi:ATP-binding cassette subfamily D (ALD) long-chain fatty acid import protein